MLPSCVDTEGGFNTGSHETAPPGEVDDGDDDGVEAVEDTRLDECGVPAHLGGVVMGYVPSWNSDFEGLLASLDLDTLTHVALAFTNPTGPGETTELPWVDDEVVELFVARAHGKGVKILASIGGINHSELISEKIKPPHVDAYIDDLEGFLSRFSLDGIDVDIEGGAVDSSYGPFVKALAERLRPQGKLITAAVGGWFQDGIVDEALFCFDFIGDMAYDAAGGWSEPGEHSSRAFARQRVRYWTSNRGYPAHRVVIGMPFYGYCWGSDCERDGGQISFRNIVQGYETDLSSDWIRPEGLDLQINFNTPDTIAYKVDLAKDYGGVMIWEMSQDSPDTLLFDAVRAGLGSL